MKMPAVVGKAAKWCEQLRNYGTGGVRVVRQGNSCSAEATDGRRLLRIDWEDEGPELDCVLDAKPFAKVKGPYAMGDSPNGVAQVNGADVPTLSPDDYGPWPDTAKVLTEDMGEAPTVLLDPKFVKAMAEAAIAAGCESLSVTVKDATSQTVWAGTGPGVRVTGVIMPRASD